jgi:hypothetical protein
MSAVAEAVRLAGPFETAIPGCWWLLMAGFMRKTQRLIRLFDDFWLTAVIIIKQGI